MYYYETLLLLSSLATDDEVAAIEKTAKAELKAAKGSLGAFDKWGKYRLAYPVKKQEYGMYILVRYEIPEDSDFYAKFEKYLRVRCTESVMRYVNVRLTETAYRAPYLKPEPIDANAGTDGFAKDNKTSGGFKKSHTGGPRRSYTPRHEASAGAQQGGATNAESVSTEVGE